MSSYILLFNAFLLGSIPFAYIISWMWTRIDIRTLGSGNVGATNVLRVVGVIPAILTLLCDAGKGVLAVALACNQGDLTLVALCGIAVVLGHCYSPFLRFKGGKGMATAAGVAVFLMPLGCAPLVVLFVLVVLVSRFVSLASIIIAVMLPVMALVFNYPLQYVWMSIALAIIVTFRHRENIKRLRNGTEGHILEKKEKERQI
ncbi:MAG: glycerol-3-phosphate 1-O-acyltransferase PlsY [Syntrophomonadaceae bacterium]|nr:glycerol-3-phosphate 1-O-acyltransferase PlsY [Syntrophomonadaceae bacterium]